VDELHLTICPKIFGGWEAPTIAGGGGFRRLTGATPLQIKSFKRVGNEAFAVFTVCGQK
jgi:riboflavin biosynthesis pyrimidine reductase